MAYVGNTPSEETIIKAEARKSLAIGLWIQDQSGRSLDITDATLRFVARKSPLPGTGNDDSAALISVEAVLTDPGVGFANVYIQAADLNLPVDEYAMSVVMVSEGYSATLLKGQLVVLENSEYTSVGDTYVGDNPALSLTVQLQGSRVINVFTGPTLVPGTTSFTISDMQKLANIEAGAQVNDPPELPGGGSKNAVLTKASNADGDVKWAAQSSAGGSGLDASGITAGYVPTADGTDNWDWAPAAPETVDADTIVDGETNAAYTQVEKTKLAGLSADYNDLDNLPTLGTAAAADADAFAAAAHNHNASAITAGTVDPARLPRIGSILGNTYGTAAPTGGSDGDEYFQYTP